MSDIDFNTAVTNLIKDSAASFNVTEQKEAKTVDISEVEEKKPTKTAGGWQRTRMCACPSDAATDCRFHSQSEPGWEICPHIKGKKPGQYKARQLWVNTSPQVIDDDPTEAQDAALEAKLALR